MTSNHANHNHINQNNERLEEHIVEEDEKMLEGMVKKMKLDGSTDTQICNFLSKKAETYLKFLDRYCSEKKCDEYRRDE